MSSEVRNPNGRLVVGERGRELEIDRIFSVGIDRLWTAVTNSEQLAGWIGRWDGDPETGEVTFYMTAEGDDIPGAPTKISSCIPPFRYSVQVDTDPASWQIQVELSEAVHGSQLRFRQVIDGTELENVGPGWEFYLDRLGTFLIGEDVRQVNWQEYYPAMRDYYQVLGESGATG